MIFVWLAAMVVLAAPEARAAAKDKGLDVLISADAIPSPEGFRPKAGQPIHYLYFQNSQTLGDPVGGVKLPPAEAVEKAVVAELAKQGFLRTQEGGALPQIALIATFGDSNFEEPPLPPDNPYDDGEFRNYLEMVNLRRILQPEFLWEKVPQTIQQLFDPPTRTSKGSKDDSYPSSNPDIRRAQGLVVDEALRYRERGSPRWHDREKIKALVGAGKVDRAVSDRKLGSEEARRIAWAAWDNQLYVTLSAFDVRRQENGGRRLLWRTTMLIDWRVDFSKALTEMLAQAGPVFGTDVPIPGIVNTANRQATVQVGTPTVVPEKAAGGESAPPVK